MLDQLFTDPTSPLDNNPLTSSLHGIDTNPLCYIRRSCLWSHTIICCTLIPWSSFKHIESCRSGSYKVGREVRQTYICNFPALHFNRINKNFMDFCKRGGGGQFLQNGDFHTCFFDWSPPGQQLCLSSVLISRFRSSTNKTRSCCNCKYDAWCWPSFACFSMSSGGWYVLCKVLAESLAVRRLSQALSVDLRYVFLKTGKLKVTSGHCNMRAVIVESYIIQYKCKPFLWTPYNNDKNIHRKLITWKVQSNINIFFINFQNVRFYKIT